MRTPWTLSTIEALIFFGLVLLLAGAGTWASAVGWTSISAPSAASFTVRAISICGAGVEIQRGEAQGIDGRGVDFNAGAFDDFGEVAERLNSFSRSPAPGLPSLDPLQIEDRVLIDRDLAHGFLVIWSLCDDAQVSRLDRKSPARRIEAQAGSSWDLPAPSGSAGGEFM